MLDLLNNLDGRATQKAVEKVLRQYRTYLLTVPEENMPAITAKYTIEMPNFSNQFNSGVENKALENVEFPMKFSKFLSYFNRGFIKLNKVERQIISMCYLEEEAMYNYEIYTMLNMSESKFYRLRTRALYKLALGLGIEVYQVDEVKTS